MAKMRKPKLKKQKKSKKYLIIEGIVLLVLGLIVGGGYYYYSVKNKDNNNENKKTNNDIIPPEVKKINIVDPDSKSRPYAVMINNVGTARPLQSGLQDAYIIYEIIVEGGISRYLALYLDASTERIGSIRSARHYFLDYALENDAIYVHHGQSPQAQSDFSSLGIDRIEATPSKTGWRDTKLKVASEHTLFSSIEKLNNGIGSKRTERNKDLLLNYSVDEVDLSKMDNAQKADSVSITYSSLVSSYKYDAQKGVYKRYVNDKAHSDYVTKNQYTFKNIITYQVTNTNVAGDTSGRQNLSNVGSGTGYYITNGYAVPITWSKSSRSAQTIYKFENGEELTVSDGNTFIQIQPTGKKLSIEGV